MATDLDDADRALLATDACVVDLDAVAAAACAEFWRDSPLAGMGEWAHATDEMREGWHAIASAALRAAGLVPGDPSLPLLLAAVWRRFGEASLYLHRYDPPTTYEAIVEHRSIPPSGEERTCWYGYAADPTTALARAFCAAVRAADPVDREG